MHSLPLVDGLMPIQPFLELAVIFGMLTLGAYWLEQRDYRLNKLFQAAAAFAIVYWYLKYRLYPPLPFTVLVTYLVGASLAIWGWVSSNEGYWKDFCRPLIAVMDGSTPRMRALRMVTVALLPVLVWVLAYNALLPPDPSTLVELRVYNPAPPAEITVYSPEDFHH